MYFLSQASDTMELEFVGYELKELQSIREEARITISILSTYLCDFPPY